MALIRHAEADRIARDAIVLDLGDVRAQAELIMSQAKAQASKAILAARAERERIIAGAQEEGYRAGFEKGHAEGLVKGTEDGNAAALVERKGELSRLDSAWSAIRWRDRTRRAVESTRSEPPRSCREDSVPRSSSSGGSSQRSESWLRTGVEFPECRKSARLGR